MQITFNYHNWNLNSQVQNRAKENRYHVIAKSFLSLIEEIPVDRLLLVVKSYKLIKSVNQINAQAHSAHRLPLGKREKPSYASPRAIVTSKYHPGNAERPPNSKDCTEQSVAESRRRVIFKLMEPVHSDENPEDDGE